MKVCFFGMGSIGKRHLKNLTVRCEKRGIPLEAYAFRSRASFDLPPDIAALLEGQITDDQYLENRYDAVFITNPTSLHYKTLLSMKGHTSCYFIEKPVFDRCDYDIDVLDLGGAAYYVATPLRHTGVVQKLKEIVEVEQTYSVRAIASSYLPDWRPGVDYRTIYSAIKAQGGGVRIDLIHEWDYLTYLFGIPDHISSFSGTYSRLEITSEDLAIYIASYPDKLLELHLDYFGRETRRNVELFTKNRLITGDIANSRITFSDGAPDIVFQEGANDKYIREMDYFLDLWEGKQKDSINDIHHALRVLRISGM